MKTLTLMAMIFLSCSTTKEKNDLEKINLLGSVKSIQEFEYSGKYLFNEIQLGKKKSYQSRPKTTFNKKGYLLEYVEYDEYTQSKEILEKKITYIYDTKERLIKKSVYGKYSGRSKDTEYKYNENDQLISEKNPYEIKYNYNKQNQISETIYSDSDRIKHNYDDHNNMVSQSRYVLKDTLYKKQTFRNEYNGKGELIGVLDSLFSYYKYDYTYTSYIKEDTPKVTMHHRKYNKGLITSDFSSVSGIMDNVNYVYEYDEQGNWINKINMDVIKDVKSITKREIIYYTQQEN